MWLYTCFCSSSFSHHHQFFRLILSDLTSSSSSPSCTNRSHSRITSTPNTGDEVEWPAYLFSPPPPPLTSTPTSERSPLYFGIWPPPSVSVKTIGCEIENNHVERDWDGSSLSSSPSLSMDSWLLLIKSTRDWTITHKMLFFFCCWRVRNITFCSNDSSARLSG